MWNKRVSVKAKKFRGINIETRVIDNDSLETVTRVKAGGAYGHSVEIGIYEAMWPLSLKIGSTLADIGQLSFRESGTSQEASCWDWETTLFPKLRGGEEKRLLLCGSPKKRNHDQIVVRIDGDHAGAEDLLLKVPID
jgi:hypothetical protein